MLHTDAHHIQRAAATYKAYAKLAAELVHLPR
jgi:hypothetical protein